MDERDEIFAEAKSYLQGEVIKEKVDDKIEEVAKKFHEIYFRIFWDGAIREGRAGREYDPEQNSWENFSEGHKEALRATVKELIESGMIEIGG